MTNATNGRGHYALTIKQENFCLAYIETGNASEAYRRCYNCAKMKPESINRLAKAALDNIKIASRIKELRKPIIERHKITVDDLVRELEEAREIAKQCANPQVSAMVRATLGKAELLGLMNGQPDGENKPEPKQIVFTVSDASS